MIKTSDKGDNIFRPLCIILPQMSGYYFDNGGKIMSFMNEDDIAMIRKNEIWNKIRKTLNIKFHSMSVYDKK